MTPALPYKNTNLFGDIQMARPVLSLYANDNPDYWNNPGGGHNPVQVSNIDEIGYNRRDRREFNGSITLNWDIPWVKGLSAKGLFSYDYNNKYTRDWVKEYKDYVYDKEIEPDLLQ